MFFGFGSPKGVTRISPQEGLEKIRESGTQLLDVRTVDEYRNIRIPGSRLIPLDQLQARAGADLPDKEVPIVVYCHSGGRSAQAAKLLASLGYAKVYDMGGIMNWPYETQSGRVN